MAQSLRAGLLHEKKQVRFAVRKPIFLDFKKSDREDLFRRKLALRTAFTKREFRGLDTLIVNLQKILPEIAPKFDSHGIRKDRSLSILVLGGSGEGKTSVTEQIARLGKSAQIVPLDGFFKGQRTVGTQRYQWDFAHAYKWDAEENVDKNALQAMARSLVRGDSIIPSQERLTPPEGIWSFTPKKLNTTRCDMVIVEGFTGSFLPTEILSAFDIVVQLKVPQAYSLTGRMESSIVKQSYVDTWTQLKTYFGYYGDNVEARGGVLRSQLARGKREDTISKLPNTLSLDNGNPDTIWPLSLNEEAQKHIKTYNEVVKQSQDFEKVTYSFPDNSNLTLVKSKSGDAVYMVRKRSNQTLLIPIQNIEGQKIPWHEVEKLMRELEVIKGEFSKKSNI